MTIASVSYLPVSDKWEWKHYMIILITVHFPELSQRLRIKLGEDNASAVSEHILS